MSDHTNSHSPACDHLTASARRYMDPAQCSTCRAYQRGRVDAAVAHADAWAASRGDSRAVERVRNLHQNEPVADYIEHTDLCREWHETCNDAGCEYYEGDWCHECNQKWPCNTLQALDGEQA